MKKWKIPEKGPLFYPPFSEWRKILLKSNAPFRDESRSLRKWIVQKFGLEYTEKPWLVTGHQPSLFHPGIWVRNIILELFSQEFFSLYIVLDHDKPERLFIPFPRKDNRLRIVEEFFPLKKIKNPVEKIPPPSEKDLDLFFSRIKNHLRTLAYNPLLYKIDRAHELAMDSLKYADNFAQFMKLWRNLEEGEVHYKEVFTSSISKSPEFRRFFLNIALNAHDFLMIYNESLKNYRISHKIRTQAQPFPDLKCYNKMVELPFWIIYGEERVPLFISGNTLFVHNDRLKEIDFDDPESLTGLEIRPKAVTLSLFTRLFLSDLFIHGIGGARYQEIVDSLIKRFYSLPPPFYALATLSMGLNIPCKYITENKIREIEELEKEVKYHPEKFLSPLSPNAYLVEEKKNCIKKISSHSVDKKIAGQLIKRIDGILLKELEPLLKYLDNEKARLKDLYEDWRVLNYREYPFILFNPQEVKDALFQKVGPLS